MLLGWQANHTKVPSYPKRRRSLRHRQSSLSPCTGVNGTRRVALESLSPRRRKKRLRRNMRELRKIWFGWEKQSIDKSSMPCHKFVKFLPIQHENLINSIYFPENKSSEREREDINQICLLLVAAHPNQTLIRLISSHRRERHEGEPKICQRRYLVIIIKKIFFFALTAGRPYCHTLRSQFIIKFAFMMFTFVNIWGLLGVKLLLLRNHFEGS